MKSGWLRYILFAALVAYGGTVEAANAMNSESPLGINLYAMAYWNAEQPFINAMKTAGASAKNPSVWITHSDDWDTHESEYLDLDVDGYPVSLKATGSDPHSPQLFKSVGVLLFRGLPDSDTGKGPPYRPGRYVVLYDGEGKIQYGFDARLVVSSPGRDVIVVEKPTTLGGVDLRITSTDPKGNGNHIRNIRVVKEEEEGLLKSGRIFSPRFLEMLKKFRVIRAMQWQNIDDVGGEVETWRDRSKPSDAGWGVGRGVPIETIVELCNELGSDCWLCVPHAANDDYISRMADLVHKSLDRGLKVYIEFSNEVWNGGYRQYHYAAMMGKLTWPDTGKSDWELNRNWYGMRTAQVCDAWKSTWGSDKDRVVCVLGAQSVYPRTALESLRCPLWVGAKGAPCVDHGIDAVAIAPYFSFNAPASWTNAGDGGLAQLFTELNVGGQIPGGNPGGELKGVSDAEAAFQVALAPYNLPLIAYEGGQEFVGYGHDSPVVKLYVAANRSPLMKEAYLRALTDWKRNAGHIYVVYGDVAAAGEGGEFGALESFLDTVSPLSKAPPKWQAIQTFIDENPCWWRGCASVIGPSPQGTH